MSTMVFPTASANGAGGSLQDSAPQTTMLEARDPALRLAGQTRLTRSQSINIMSDILDRSLSGATLSRTASLSGRALGADDERRFRQAYVDALELGCGRAVLLAVAERIKAVQLGGAPRTDEAGDGRAPISWALRTVTAPTLRLAFGEASVVSIGQQGYENDLELPLSQGLPVCSRVHVVIMPLRDGQLLLCDVGSIAGFHLLRRPRQAPGQGDAEAVVLPEDVSKPGARRPLLIAATEAAALILRPTGRRVVIEPGDAAATLSTGDACEPGNAGADVRADAAPASGTDGADAANEDDPLASRRRECIVCYEAPREIAFDCGHFVCCGACGRRVAACPVCRIETRRVARVSAGRTLTYTSPEVPRGVSELRSI